MKLLSKTDAISAVPNWKYWYCYKCEEVFLRTDSVDRDFGRYVWQTICPKCHTNRCDPCVWVLHCHEEQLGSLTVGHKEWFSAAVAHMVEQLSCKQ